MEIFENKIIINIDSDQDLEIIKISALSNADEDHNINFFINKTNIVKFLKFLKKVSDYAKDKFGKDYEEAFKNITFNFDKVIYGSYSIVKEKKGFFILSNQGSSEEFILIKDIDNFKNLIYLEALRNEIYLEDLKGEDYE